jgi:hypothetical protein
MHAARNVVLYAQLRQRSAKSGAGFVNIFAGKLIVGGELGFAPQSGIFADNRTMP